MPTQPATPENPAIPYLYMFLYRNRKAKKHLSNHSKSNNRKTVNRKQ